MRKGSCGTEQSILLGVIDCPDEGDIDTIDMWLDVRFEPNQMFGTYISGDDQRNASPTGRFYRQMRPFDFFDPAEEHDQGTSAATSGAKSYIGSGTPL